MSLRPTTVVAVCLFLSACGSSSQPGGAESSGGAQPPIGSLPSKAAVTATTLPASAPPLPPPAAAPLLAYLDGLDALNQGKWADAVTAFSRALNGSGDDASFVLARGVAATLAEQFPQGLNDLARVRQLAPRTREAELWTYAAEAMSGIVSPEHTLGGAPLHGQVETRPLVSIPGHMAQGGNDYTSAYGTVIAYELGDAYQRLRLPPDLGGAGSPDAVRGAPKRAAMLKAGQWFAARAMRRADLAPAHASRAIALHDARQYEAALREIEYARAAYPDNPDLVYISANCWLALGRPVTARREYTLALTGQTAFVQGYLGRAAAAARMGDETRVAADLKVAQKLDSGATSRVRSTIESDLAKARVEGTAAKLVADLAAAAGNGATSPDALVEIGLRAHKASAAHRLRYDEIYQDTVRALEDAVRASPRSADRLADLARYLVAEADNRGEAVEPRRATETYRTQASRESELTRAIRVADLALVIDNAHAGALIQKALALTALKRYDEAEAAADKALAAAGNNADALRLYARFRATRADQMSSEAFGLRQERCSSSSRDEDRGSYIERVTTTTCYPPSQADVARASQLEAAAADLRRRARAAMERAAQASRGTVEGFLIEADLRLWDGDSQRAQAALEQAVKLDPKSIDAQDALVDFYAQNGQADRAEEQQAIERQLIHTTAAPLLRLAWRQTQRTAWSAAGDYLTRAQQLDPVDARVFAYRGVMLEGQGRAADAAAAYRSAVALEDARVRLDEPGAGVGVGVGTALTRDPADFALAMRLRARLAAQSESARDMAGAASLYASNTALRSRISPSQYSREMFPAMLPDDRPQGGAVVPAPQNAATLLAQSSLAAGKAYQALGRQTEAQQQFLVAASFVPAPGSNVPRIGNARGDTNFGNQATSGSGEALFELAKSFMQAGQYDQAQRYLQAASNAGIPPALREDVNQMNFALARMLSNQRQSQVQAQSQSTYQGNDRGQQNANDLARQQDAERAQQTYRYMAANARVAPELIGRWDLTPENAFLPLRRTLVLDQGANYVMTSQDGTTSRGKVNVQGNPVRGRDEPLNGQMLLVSPDGSQDVLYFEFSGRDVLQVTAQDGTKYTARRR